ncbi:MAG: isocitrate lyase/phosphoenolpyruvate mutase family protein [Deltaproteobacteria bacterium]|nr:isocitrate lyase/phosphoenolpyruvate mutase family protein [Deltaproteobacteria bacterium]
MTASAAPQRTAIATFRQLHSSGCFVLPNPWDIGTSVFLQHLGFKALATTSAGVAFTRGRADAVWALPLEVMLAHTREIVAATSLPVNADFQSGFARDPEGVARNVRACVETGVAGLSIEDATGDAGSPLYERKEAIARFAAARAAIDASGVPVLLTARCEAWLVRHPDARRITLDRLVAFAEAGADCLYAPGVRDLAEIEAIVRAVAPKPVNVLVAWPNPELTVERLAGIGVRRISVGSALARVAWGAFIRAAKSIIGTGNFQSLAEAAPFQELDDVFGKDGLE